MPYLAVMASISLILCLFCVAATMISSLIGIYSLSFLIKYTILYLNLWYYMYVYNYRR